MKDPSGSGTVSKPSSSLHPQQSLILPPPHQVVLSTHNSLPSTRYFDPQTQTSFALDPLSLKTFDSQPHSPQQNPLAQNLQSAFANSITEHFPSSTIGIYPCAAASGDQIAILIVANKYSPQNFWNGRWRSTYFFSPASNSLTGTIKVDVHYYEDGNVRMATSKSVEIPSPGPGGAGAEGVVRAVAKAENAFQEELNRGFVAMAEGSFKGLRRQLPVTRQRVEWEKIGGYRVSFCCVRREALEGRCADFWLRSLGRILGVGGRSKCGWMACGAFGEALSLSCADVGTPLWFHQPGA